MRWLWIATLAITAFFLFFPRLDITLSSAFFSFPEHNIEPQGFAAQQSKPWVRAIFLWVRYLSVAYVVLFLAVGIYKRCFGLAWISWRQWSYLGLVLLAGNFLMVDIIGKDFLHRPRPRDITEFRGALDYVPPLHIGTQEGKSAASGHAAFGFYFAAFAFLCRRRTPLYILGVALGLGIGFTRIMAGGHFASDVLFTGLIMLWTIHLLAWIILRERNNA